MTRPLTSKVLLIGWDAADWKIITPLLDAGEMPNLERFVSGGVMGNLSTLFPVLSPMLWTSIATGKRAHKHGIHGFAEPDPRSGGVRPITNLGRKTKAIWNILNQSGLRSNVIGWWPSHPVEPINGVMVSNHFKDMDKKAGKPWRIIPGAVHPNRLRGPLHEFRIHWTDLEPQQLLPFVPNAHQIDQEKDKRVYSVAKTLAEAATIHGAATAIMQLEPWDFMGVYFDAIDHFCHGFMKYHPPRLGWITEEDFELYKNVVNEAYRFHDLMLGATMALAGDDTTIIIVSDHGFHPDHLRPKELPNEPAGAADEHRPYGIIAMRGPGVKRDELVFGASLLDVTPTILALLGLPVGRDMDGKPLVDAFTKNHNVSYIDSWDDVEGDAGLHPPDLQMDPVDSHEAMKQLVELGYIDGVDEDHEKAVANTVRELRYNLARDYYDAQRFPDAIKLFTDLWNDCPDEGRFGVKLLECYLKLGRPKEARETYKKLWREKQRYAKTARKDLKKLSKELEETKDEDIKQKDIARFRQLRRQAGFNQDAFKFLHGCLLQIEGKHEEALAAFTRAENVQVHNRPTLYHRMGESLRALERWGEAETQYERMLAIDPINAGAHIGLCQCHLACRRPRKALQEITAAIGLYHHNPRSHYLCGVALKRLRRTRQALKAFKTAIDQNPAFPDAHDEIADLYDSWNETDKAKAHRKQAREAEKRIVEFRSGTLLPESENELQIDLKELASIGALGAPTVQDPLPEDGIVVVSGLPRSGTSMMMQMLAAGGLPVLTDNVRVADESNLRGYYELEAVKRLGQDDEWLKDAGGKAVKIVAQLLIHLPADRAYRLIFMERPLGEVVTSQFTMLQRLGREGAKLSQRRLAFTFQRQLRRVQKVLETVKQRDVEILSVDYHQALAESVATAAMVNSFLGGGLDEAAMARAIDPSLHRERIA